MKPKRISLSCTILITIILCLGVYKCRDYTDLKNVFERACVVRYRHAFVYANDEA